LIAAAFILALGALWAGQPEPEPNAKAIDDAKNLYEAGTRAYETERYDTAIMFFEESYKLATRAATLYALAQSHRLQFFRDSDPVKLRRAVDLYRAFVDMTPTGGRREQARSHLAVLEPLLARIDERSPRPLALDQPKTDKTQLLISSATLGAQVALGDGEWVEAPAVLDVKPGRYTLRLSAPGHFPENVEVFAVEGRAVSVNLNLKPKPALVSVRAPEGAQVSIDGRVEGPAPLFSPVSIGAGKHLVAVSERGAYPFEQAIDLREGESATVEAELEPTAQRTTAWYLLGGGAVLSAAAGIVALSAIGPQNRALDIERLMMGIGARALTTDEALAHDRYASERDGRALASGIIASGAVLTAGIGVLLYFLDAPPRLAPTH
jgi:hypothetical protein